MRCHSLEQLQGLIQLEQRRDEWRKVRYRDIEKPRLGYLGSWMERLQHFAVCLLCRAGQRGGVVDQGVGIITYR